MIEAEVPPDDQATHDDVTRITGKAHRHEFDATCLKLETILVSFVSFFICGLSVRKPETVAAN